MSDNVMTLLTIILPFVCTGFGWCIKSLKDKRKGEDVMQEAMKVLLRRELTTQRTYFCSVGYITESGLKEFENTLSIYEKLIGENGFVDDLKCDVRNLDMR